MTGAAAGGRGRGFAAAGLAPSEQTLAQTLILIPIMVIGTVEEAMAHFQGMVDAALPHAYERSGCCWPCP